MVDTMEKIRQTSKWYLEALQLFNNGTDRMSGAYDEMKHTYDERFKRDLYAILTEGKVALTYEEFIASLTPPPTEPKPGRCCGQCDGVNDLCVADMTCENHSVTGCETCYGVR